MSSNMWDADPELYAKLAEPMENQEQALLNAKGFLLEVRRLREKYHVPELIVQYVIYCKDDEGPLALSGGAGWGDQMKQLNLAHMCMNRELAALGNIVDKISSSFPRVAAELITDPKIEKPKKEPQ